MIPSFKSRSLIILARSVTVRWLVITQDSLKLRHSFLPPSGNRFPLFLCSKKTVTFVSKRVEARRCAMMSKHPLSLRNSEGNVRGGESDAYPHTIWPFQREEKSIPVTFAHLHGGKSQTSTPVTGSFLYRYQEKILRSLDRVRLTFSRDTPFVGD